MERQAGNIKKENNKLKKNILNAQVTQKTVEPNANLSPLPLDALVL